jgi:hypothetical protein
LTDSDLRDPSPPMPGGKERAAVATRAHQLGRRRRMLQGAGALGMVAAVAVGVAALTAGGTSSGPGGQRLEVANAPTGDAPTIDPTPPVAAPSGFTVAGTVTNVPEGVRLTVTLAGSSGTFRAIVEPSGHFSIGGVPAGDYDTAYEWVSTDGTATQVGKLGAVSITGDRDVSFGLP